MRAQLQVLRVWVSGFPAPPPPPPGGEGLFDNSLNPKPLTLKPEREPPGSPAVLGGLGIEGLGRLELREGGGGGLGFRVWRVRG